MAVLRRSGQGDRSPCFQRLRCRVDRGAISMCWRDVYVLSFPADVPADVNVPNMTAPATFGTTPAWTTKIMIPAVRLQADDFLFDGHARVPLFFPFLIGRWFPLGKDLPSTTLARRIRERGRPMGAYGSDSGIRPDGPVFFAYSRSSKLSIVPLAIAWMDSARKRVTSSRSPGLSRPSAISRRQRRRTLSLSGPPGKGTRRSGNGLPSDDPERDC